MALAPAPLKIQIDVPGKQGRDAASIYVGGGRFGVGGGSDFGSVNEGGAFAFSDNLQWSAWYINLVAYINTLTTLSTVITCGGDSDTIQDWVCNLWADDQALQSAVLAIDSRLNAITCGLDTFDLETWICALNSDVLTLSGAVASIDDRLNNVAILSCGSPFTQSLEDTLQTIIDNVWFDIGAGCAPVIDYITDIYGQLALIPSYFMPIDVNGSGMVPSGEGIYVPGAGPPAVAAGMFLDPDVVFYSSDAQIGGFVATALPSMTNIFAVVDRGAGPELVQLELLTDPSVTTGFFVGLTF